MQKGASVMLFGASLMQKGSALHLFGTGLMQKGATDHLKDGMSDLFGATFPEKGARRRFEVEKQFLFEGK